MGNQGKIAKQQSGKIYVFLHISVRRFIFEKKSFTVFRETKRKIMVSWRNPFSIFTSVFELLELAISLLTRVSEMLFLWLEGLPGEGLRLDQVIRF